MSQIFKKKTTKELSEDIILFEEKFNKIEVIKHLNKKVETMEKKLNETVPDRSDKEQDPRATPISYPCKICDSTFESSHEGES